MELRGVWEERVRADFIQVPFDVRMGLVIVQKTFALSIWGTDFKQNLINIVPTVRIGRIKLNKP